MAHKEPSRVRQRSVTTGTGTYTLVGDAALSFRTFAAALSDGDTVDCVVVMGANYELGRYTYSAGTLARTAILKSSNGNAAVDWSAGTKDIAATWIGPLDGAAAGYGRLLKALAADVTGADSSTAQPWFPASGAVAVAAATVYEFEGKLRLTRAAGIASHTIGLLFAGTATVTSIDWVAIAREGDAAALAGAAMVEGNVATEVVVKAASTSATEDVLILVRGILRVNAAGTFVPQFKYSAAPGGAPTIKRGSFFMLRSLDAVSATAETSGTWS